MTKEEKIKNAYGEYWEQLKPFIDDNGWMFSIDFPLHNKSIEIEEHPNRYSVRPKSLQGIENNIRGAGRKSIYGGKETVLHRVLLLKEKETEMKADIKAIQEKYRNHEN